MANKQANKPKVLAMDSDGCVGVGETYMDALRELIGNSGYDDMQNFTYYVLTPVQVDLVEVGK